MILLLNSYKRFFKKYNSFSIFSEEFRETSSRHLYIDLSETVPTVVLVPFKPEKLRTWMLTTWDEDLQDVGKCIHDTSSCLTVTPNNPCRMQIDPPSPSLRLVSLSFPSPCLIARNQCQKCSRYQEQQLFPCTSFATWI